MKTVELTHNTTVDAPMVLNIEIQSDVCDFNHGSGWVDSIKEALLLPYPQNEVELRKYLVRVFSDIQAVPLDNMCTAEEDCNLVSLCLIQLGQAVKANLGTKLLNHTFKGMNDEPMLTVSTKLSYRYEDDVPEEKPLTAAIA